MRLKMLLLLATGIALGTAIGAVHAGVTIEINNSWPIKGSGQIRSETRALADFDSIELEDSSDLQIMIGDRFAVTVTADDNLLPLIGTEVHGHRLSIGPKGSYRTRHSPKIAIQLPRLQALQISGSGDVDIGGLNDGALKLAIDGSGDIKARGAVDQLTLSIQGSGDINADAVTADRVDVEIDGSGDATVFAAKALNAVINGSGDITYRGSGAVVQQTVHGSGEVHKR